MTAYGAYDMAGNVREWGRFNEGKSGRVVRGGAWDDAAYMWEQAKPGIGVRPITREWVPLRAVPGPR